MNKFLLHLRVLDGILDKKINTLDRILILTEKQKEFLTVESHDNSALHLYKETNDEKQKLIDVIIESDKLFEKTYQEIGPEFEVEAPKHAELVKQIQEGIKRATTLNVNIRVQEARNNVAQPMRKKVPNNKPMRKKIAWAYEKNKTPKKGELGGV